MTMALDDEARQVVIELMGAVGVTQSELARRLGVTPAAVSNVLAGHTSRGLTLARLERYLAALGYRAVLQVEPSQPTANEVSP